MQATGDGQYQHEYFLKEWKVLEVPKQFTYSPIVHNSEDQARTDEWGIQEHFVALSPTLKVSHQEDYGYEATIWLNYACEECTTSGCLYRLGKQLPSHFNPMSRNPFCRILYSVYGQIRAAFHVLLAKQAHHLEKTVHKTLCTCVPSNRQWRFQ